MDSDSLYCLVCNMLLMYRAIFSVPGFVCICKYACVFADRLDRQADRHTHSIE